MYHYLTDNQTHSNLSELFDWAKENGHTVISETIPPKQAMAKNKDITIKLPAAHFAASLH